MARFAIGLALLLALGACANPPAPAGGKLELRLVLNEDSRPLALAALSDPDLRARVGDIADYVLSQAPDINVWRYRPEAPDAGTPREWLATYEDWAAFAGLRWVGSYRMAEGEARLYYSMADGGGLLGAMADNERLTVAWAPGRIALGPLAAAWLGLPGEVVPATVPEGLESRMPELPPDLPDDLLDIRLNLGAEELRPLADDVSRRLREAPDSVESDLAALLSKGARVLAPVRGLVALVYATASPEDVERVRAPALAYASAKGWLPVLQYGEGDKRAELLAGFGAGGGAVVIGRRGDRTAVLLTEGCPDLMGLLAP